MSVAPLFTSVSGQSFHSFAEAASYFRSYFTDLLCQTAPVLLVAFGMTLVLMTSGIDLSVGSLVALVACVMSSFPSGPNFWWTAVPLGLAQILEVIEKRLHDVAVADELFVTFLEKTL